MARKKIFLYLVMALSILVFGPERGQAGTAPSRVGVVAMEVTVETGPGAHETDLWLPYPVSNEYQTIEDVRLDGNFTENALYRDAATGGLMLYARWKKGSASPRLSLTFRARAEERLRKDFPQTRVTARESIPVEVLPYLRSTELLPTGGRIGAIARKVTRGKKGTLEKARAVYDWVVENLARDPHVRGCGLGDVEVTLAKKSGKCADISSVFVAVARGAGVAAREVFGLRLGKKDNEDITGGHHCWAEFYLPGYGWVPVDPADVRKVMLKKGLNLEEAGKYREYYFGAVDQYRVALIKGRVRSLTPAQKGPPLTYFMYPYAEVDGRPLEYIAAQKRLKYRITFRALPLERTQGAIDPRGR